MRAFWRAASGAGHDRGFAELVSAGEPAHVTTATGYFFLRGCHFLSPCWLGPSVLGRSLVLELAFNFQGWTVRPFIPFGSSSLSRLKKGFVWSASRKRSDLRSNPLRTESKCPYIPPGRGVETAPEAAVA